MLDRARRLRREHTSAEARLWNALRARRLGGWKWYRQVPKPPYIVDFLCPAAGLVVELDGGQHSDRHTYDHSRTLHLGGLGLRVVRFWNFEVHESRDDVCRVILQACGGEYGGPSPYPLPSTLRVGRGVRRQLHLLSPRAARGERVG